MKRLVQKTHELGAMARWPSFMVVFDAGLMLAGGFMVVLVVFFNGGLMVVLLVFDGGLMVVFMVT